MARVCCPICGSTYEVPAALLQPPGNGSALPRKLRCRVCAAVFTADDAMAADHAGAARPEAPPRPARLATALAVAAGLASGAVAGAASALLLRPDVVATIAGDDSLPPALRRALAAMPAVARPAARLAAAAGPVTPLRFDVSSRLDALPDGAMVLEVAGEIVNPTSAPSGVPALELRLLDALGRTLERRPVRASATAVPAGGRIAFSAVALNLPHGATSARLVAASALLDPL